MVRRLLCLAMAGVLANVAPALAETTTAAVPSVIPAATDPVPAAPAAQANSSTQSATHAAAPPVAARKSKPETTLAIDIDLTRQRMTITENGLVAGSWPISSGREGYRSPAGTFRPMWMSRMWYSKKYDNAPMPHAVFFSGGVAMHATQATGQLGQPASHGCIRQSPANAATTFRLVQKHGNAHTRIVVHGTPHDAEPQMARRERREQDSGIARIAARPSPAMPPAGMRRVILVDGDGNRRIGEIPANDPRLIAYQRRISAMAYHPRSY